MGTMLANHPYTSIEPTPGIIGGPMSVQQWFHVAYQFWANAGPTSAETLAKNWQARRVLSNIGAMLANNHHIRYHWWANVSPTVVLCTIYLLK